MHLSRPSRLTQSAVLSNGVIYGHGTLRASPDDPRSRRDENATAVIRAKVHSRRSAPDRPRHPQGIIARRCQSSPQWTEAQSHQPPQEQRSPAGGWRLLYSARPAEADHRALPLPPTNTMDTIQRPRTPTRTGTIIGAPRRSRRTWQ